MQKWEKALLQFLKKYENKPYFEGALLCGSYATGNQNEFSDIDVHILISDTQNWRERGMVRTDGFLIEYFINPIKKIKQEFRDDYSDGGNASANMFGYGKILFDKNGNVKKLKQEALRFLKKTPKKITPQKLALDFYGAWDLMDELKCAIAEKRGFDLVYYELVKKLLTIHFKLNGIAKISLAKTEKILSNPKFAKQYHIQKLPDQKFTKLFLSALQNKKQNAIQKLFNFVMTESDEFDIGQFKSKIKI